ncbi:MAG TPA: ParB N-terminal domain-containing protein [Herpetosiphonaceae bacterium]
MSKKKSINLDQFFTPSTDDADLAFLLGATPEETVQHASEHGLPLTHLPTEAIAPDRQQLRHLLDPSELTRLAESGDRAAAAVVASLRELGQSIKEHGQIQPVIVYADSDPGNPKITHRLLNGQRRWSAAVLVGLPTLWVVEVSKPKDVERLLHQFEENERREGFSDMERAWAIMALRTALHSETGADIPWNLVEGRLQLSTQRRQDLLRLLRFPQEAQAIIMRYGWSEWTLRPLHMALNSGELSPEETTDMLRVLADSPDVTISVVNALLEAYRQRVDEQSVAAEGQQTLLSARSTRHNTEKDGLQRLSRLKRGVEQLRTQLPRSADQKTRQVWRTEVEALRDSLNDLLEQL